MGSCLGLKGVGRGSVEGDGWDAYGFGGSLQKPACLGSIENEKGFDQKVMCQIK